MTTTQATRIKIYTNTETDYALTMVTDAQGIVHVTDSEGFHATTLSPTDAETILWERSLRFGAKPYQAPAPQMASPLTPAAQVPAANLGRGASLTTMNDAQATKIREALDVAGAVWRGPVSAKRHAPLSMLRAMAKRGWLELDNRIRPTFGTVTDAGRKALERHDATVTR